MSLRLALEFPNFNIYSTSLLILVVQGLIFAGLLLSRFWRRKSFPDLLLALILLITCYHRTTYTIGFMDWYDTFRNTKINYYLIPMGMLLAPLIYFYVRSVTTSDFKLRKKDLWHFFPWLIFFLIKGVILLYDMNQPGFHETQNGYLVIHFQWKYVEPIVTVFSTMQMLLYLAFSIQLFYSYRSKIQNYFSNTYKLELNWIRNFLLLYSFIFVYGLFQTLINEVFSELSWKQKWWLQFFSALVVLYVGIKGYFTDTIMLTALNFDSSKKIKATKTTSKAYSSEELLCKQQQLQDYFSKEKPYLNPDLHLTQLATALEMSRAELSEVINTGFGLNFNDFVNQYRVAAVKKMFSEKKQKELSLLGIAYDCGFNSKATFNRVFKKLTASSPSEYLKSLS